MMADPVDLYSMEHSRSVWNNADNKFVGLTVNKVLFTVPRILGLKPLNI